MSPNVQHMTKRDTLEIVALNSIGLTITDLLLTISIKFVRNPCVGFDVSTLINIRVEDPKNLIVVHCNSGKGRTGTAICAILLYIGFCDNMDDCLRFYGH